MSRPACISPVQKASHRLIASPIASSVMASPQAWIGRNTWPIKNMLMITLKFQALRRKMPHILRKNFFHLGRRYEVLAHIHVYRTYLSSFVPKIGAYSARLLAKAAYRDHRRSF